MRGDDTVNQGALTPNPSPHDRIGTSRGRGVFFALLSGTLLALAFPKFNLWWFAMNFNSSWLAWVALVPFFWALGEAKDWKESLLYGFLFGITFFGIDLFWITSLTRFVGGWAWLGWGALTVFQSLFILLFCLILKPFDKSKGYYYHCHTKPLDKSSGSYPFIIALLWTAVEWLRAWGPFGVTGGDVGYSQVYFLPLIQIASFTSVYGVSFLVVLVNAAIVDVGTAFMAVRSKRTRINLVPTFLVLFLVTGCIGYGFSVLQGSRATSGSLKLALIQPNIDQIDKMNPRLVIPIYERLEDLTRQAVREKPDVIIWPETSVFSYLLRDPVLFPRLKQLAKEANAWLIIGTPHYDESHGKIYNSIISVSPSGEVVSRYDKEHLVPFGEYLPFRPLLYPILKHLGYYEQDFDSNPDPQPIFAGKCKVAAAICFESTFPGLIKYRVKSPAIVGKDADFILVVTNDAWFDDSSAPYFHLHTGVFRAIENRKYFVQVGNTGISAVIDPLGRILKKTELNQLRFLTFEIPLS